MMTVTRIRSAGLCSRFLFDKNKCHICVSLRFKTTKQRKESEQVDKDVSKTGQKTVNSLPNRKKYSEIDFIFKYPISRCDHEIDNSILRKSAGTFLPSVTMVISETMSDMSKFYLDRWKRKMISELGLEGFKKHQEETFLNGSNLHTNIQQYLSGVSETELNINKANSGHWTSLHEVLKEVQDTLAMEEMVSHEGLCYKGKFDCLALYRDMLCVIDWKTSKKSKPTIKDTFDNPLQVAAYIGAINNSQFQLEKGFDQITRGAIVIAYSDGSPAHVHTMDKQTCEENWKLWLERLHKFWLQVRNISKEE